MLKLTNKYVAEIAKTAKWQAQPNREDGQSVGNVYEVRVHDDSDRKPWEDEYLELWVSVGGKPLRLMYVLPRREMLEYVAVRVRRGWFSPMAEAA
jgi:hypothetical protein